MIRKVDQASVDRHNSLVNDLNRMQAQKAAGMRNDRVEVVKELLSHIYGKATAYTNLIIIAGYVAFYSMWGSMKDHLPREWMLTAGLLITLSVILFVSVEIYKMILTGLHYKKVNKVLNDDQTERAISTIQQLEQEFNRRMYGFWLLMLIPTIITGIGSGIILAVAFAQQLLLELVA